MNEKSLVNLTREQNRLLCKWEAAKISNRLAQEDHNGNRINSLLCLLSKNSKLFWRQLIMDSRGDFIRQELLPFP